MLGGDHLDPYSRLNESASVAMEKATQLVIDYVQARYLKIHLDASMCLGGDMKSVLPVEIVAERTAVLCREAEETWNRLSDVKILHIM